MAEFVKGLNLKEYDTPHGKFITGGINLEEIVENPANNGWVNFAIKHGKTGKIYAEINNLKKDEQ